jgi:entericidin B
MTVILRKVLALALLGSLGTLWGCGTIEGMGKDLERGGENVQDASKDVKDDL